MNGEQERSKVLQRADVIAPWVVDGALALVVLAVSLAAAGHGSRSIHGGTAGPSTAAVISAAVLSTLPLLVRRRWPVQVLAATLVVGIAIPTAAVLWPPALVAVYTVASRRPWRVAVAGAAAATVGLYLHRLVWGYSLPLSGVIEGIALAGAALALGLYQATRLAYFEQTRERAATRIVDALEQLPPQQRDVFVKHELEGKAFAEIAAESGVRVNTLLSRKRYAVLFLRNQLKEIYDELE